MRIISDFHDYYDIGMKDGVDSQLPYRRFRREERIDDSPYPDAWYDQEQLCPYLFLGFAGKIYPMAPYFLDSGKAAYLYSLDKGNDLEEYDRWMLKQFRFDPPSKRESIDERRERECFIRDIHAEFAKWLNNRNDEYLLSLFDRFKTAIFVCKRPTPFIDEILINARLNDYHFQKILPPIEAFQELAMYVGTCLTRPTIEEPSIPDKTKAEIHGFDQYSFRKDRKKKK